MKQLALIFALALLPSFLPAEPLGPGASSHRLGIGGTLGTPTGFSAKYWFDRENALNLALGAYGFYGGRYAGGATLHLDYLWHHYGVFGSPSSAAYEHLPIYIGVGGLFSSPDVTGARAVFGLTWLFEDAPFDLFFDLAPTLVIAPYYSGIGVDAGLGGRYYF